MMLAPDVLGSYQDSEGGDGLFWSSRNPGSRHTSFHALLGSEQHDFSAGRKVREIALKTPLGEFALVSGPAEPPRGKCEGSAAA